MSSTRNAKVRPKSSNTGDPQVRIIGGQWRGRKLGFPKIDGLRPTGDRIRETLFNWLAGDLPAANCLDLFSGSGALGLEALSRGAKHATLLEFHPSAAAQLQSNLQLLNCDSAKVIHGDALSWLNKPADERFDVVFIDPPFSQDFWPEALQSLNLNNWLNVGAAIYIETPRGYHLPVPKGWDLHRQKHAGNVSYQLFYKLS